MKSILETIFEFVLSTWVMMVVTVAGMLGMVFYSVEIYWLSWILLAPGIVFSLVLGIGAFLGLTVMVHGMMESIFGKNTNAAVWGVLVFYLILIPFCIWVMLFHPRH